MKDDDEQPRQDTRDVDDDRSRTEVARRLMQEYADEMRGYPGQAAQDADQLATARASLQPNVLAH
jgi:hypothetical protein